MDYGPRGGNFRRGGRDFVKGRETGEGELCDTNDITITIENICGKIFIALSRFLGGRCMTNRSK